MIEISEILEIETTDIGDHDLVCLLLSKLGIEYSETSSFTIIVRK